eukprot:3626723-Rhodomonas_salina.1
MGLAGDAHQVSGRGRRQREGTRGGVVPTGDARRYVVVAQSLDQRVVDLCVWTHRTMDPWTIRTSGTGGRCPLGPQRA